MKQIEKHAYNSNTTVIKDWVNNGCQYFHISEFPRVIKEYDVPKQKQQDVYQMVEDNKHIEEDPAEIVKMNDDRVTALAICAGEAPKSILLSLPQYIQYELIICQPELCDILIQTEHVNVRRAAARKLPERDEWLTDIDASVRLCAAWCCADPLRFINDPSHHVQKAVHQRLEEITNLNEVPEID